MEVEDHLAAQAPTNVGKGKEIATVMLTVLATWNAVMTIAILPLDLVLSLTAAMFLWKSEMVQSQNHLLEMRLMKVIHSMNLLHFSEIGPNCCWLIVISIINKFIFAHFQVPLRIANGPVGEIEMISQLHVIVRIFCLQKSHCMINVWVMLRSTKFNLYLVDQSTLIIQPFLLTK